MLCYEIRREELWGGNLEQKIPTEVGFMYSKAPGTAAVGGEVVVGRTERPLYKMVIDTADWHGEYVTQN
jgi:hypothetical protein